VLNTCGGRAGLTVTRQPALVKVGKGLDRHAYRGELKGRTQKPTIAYAPSNRRKHVLASICRPRPIARHYLNHASVALRVTREWCHLFAAMLVQAKRLTKLLGQLHNGRQSELRRGLRGCGRYAGHFCRVDARDAINFSALSASSSSQPAHAPEG